MKIGLFIVDIIRAPFSKLSELGTEHAATGESIRDVFLVVNQRLLPPHITIYNKTIRRNMKKEIKCNKSKKKTEEEPKRCMQQTLRPVRKRKS
jgi:alkyl hydroperoxide reductase subunit AhpC